MTAALIGPRLAVVASYVPKGTRLGDIGTDHAYLPITLCEQARISYAVAIDVHKGPFESALSAVRSWGLSDKIAVRLGDGLRPLGPGEVNTLVLAGMGGSTMMDILSARPEILARVSDLIVQPQGGEGKVRRSLLAEGWLLRDEVLVEEEGRIYVVMAYAKREGYLFGSRKSEVGSQNFLHLNELKIMVEEWVGSLMESCAEALQHEVFAESVDGAFQEAIRFLVWQLGPLVLTKPNPLLRRLLEERILELSHRLEEMKKAKNPGAIERIKASVLEKLANEGLLEVLFF